MEKAGRAPTIYDVAAAAGVAPSTVSRAFARPGRVSAATAARIHQVAADLGYRVNPLARALQNGASSTVALVVSDVTNPVFFAIIRGVEAAAGAAGYTMMLADTQESESLERTLLDRLLPAVGGIVLASSRLSDRAIRAVAAQRPTVVLNRVVAGTRSVVPDTASGVEAALRQLSEMGHRSVTYVAGPEASWVNGARWRAILDVSGELGLRVARTGPNLPTVSGGLAAAEAMARRVPSAVLAYNDLLAIGLLRGFGHAGIRVPDRTSVIGFDNVFGSDFCSPPLTTVATPLRAMGTAAFQELERAMKAEPLPASPVVSLTSQLVVRGSAGPRSRKRTSPASRTTSVSASASQSPGSTVAGST
ncbi:LacI family DNA-binding transcriptional regulator [Nocardia carnea]|uniref:LacI family DNA-binding transcriptional regulator n=1 Tax=Nocardia carnea TaxID=37328 RepID=UPI0024587C21|nr:LacI family DNA-binding transcriptional regulator [Nocardia carnea]